MVDLFETGPGPPPAGSSVVAHLAVVQYGRMPTTVAKRC